MVLMLKLICILSNVQLFAVNMFTPLWCRNFILLEETRAVVTGGC